MEKPLFDEAFLAQLRREYHDAREALFAAHRVAERAEIAYQMAYADFVLATTGLRKGMEVVITPEILNVILANNAGHRPGYIESQYPIGAAVTIDDVGVDDMKGGVRTAHGTRVGGIPVPLLQKAREQWVNQFGGGRGHA